MLEKHPLVDCDLEAAALWYGRRNPAAAEALISAAELALRTAAFDPFRFPIRIGHCRRIRLPGFPYAALYEIREQTVYILAIAHLSRDLPMLMHDRFTGGS
ncbi:MAG: type II toxin-antitoxin system RelE/ParE family toxin [Verrucomicrobiae bacterium]|nr:type II toxin-antitoxin system RelE/ParE family toxin [Verrucomicrobiae bacterium]